MHEMQNFNPQTPIFQNQGARIKIIGCGGGGNNAINRMVDAEIQGVEFIAVNCDAQDLALSKATTKIPIGTNCTKGLGAGGKPEIGEKAAEEASRQLQEIVKDSDMIFITAGMGGGTGTGSAPIVAKFAKEAGALTIAVVTTPFKFEGKKRMKNALAGITKLKENVDTLITISNDKLLSIIDKKTSITQAFQTADRTLMQAVQGISSLITTPGLINLDFADVKSVMSHAGNALIGIGSYNPNEDRRNGDTHIEPIVYATQRAITNPLLDNSIEGANGILLNITGGPNLSLFEINEACSLVEDAVSEDANIIFGSVIDHNLADDEVYVTIIATNFNNKQEDILSPKVEYQTSKMQAQYQPPQMQHQPQIQSKSVVSSKPTYKENSVSIPPWMQAVNKN